MRSAEAWEMFLSGNEPAGIRDDLLASWRRSQWSGVDPFSTTIPQLDVPDDSPLIRAAVPVLLRMTDLLAGTRTSLALTDARGHILWLWVSDSELERELDRMEFARGANLNEEEVGTNGIGMSLETGHLAVVLGADHFAQSLHPWACAAAPVRHPVTRRIAGAVNITCRAEDANHFMRITARSLADGVHAAMRASASTADRRLMEAFLAHGRRATGPVVCLNPQIMVTDSTAAQLRLDHATVWDRVMGAGPRAGKINLGGGLSARVFPVDPGRLQDGVVLVLCSEMRHAPCDSALDEPPSALPAARRLTPLEQAEVEVIVQVLAECDGNKSAAAARLGISRGTLYQKLRLYRPLAQ